MQTWCGQISDWEQLNITSNEQIIPMTDLQGSQGCLVSEPGEAASEEDTGRAERSPLMCNVYK